MLITCNAVFMFGLLKNCEINIIPMSQMVKLSQKGGFLTVPVPPKKSSKPESELQEADSECIPPQHADLFGFSF